MLILPACVVNEPGKEMRSQLATEALMPACAFEAGMEVGKDYDGENGKDLEVHVFVDESCKQRWTNALEESGSFACEQDIHTFSCATGDPWTVNGDGLLVMPRKDDVLLLRRSNFKDEASG